MTNIRQGEVVLDRYRVGEALGAGGMAFVYEATDLRTGRSVAIKVMLHAFEPELVRRFEEEARAMASVSHPNVIALLAFGRAPDGSPCMVMEKLVGRDLEKRLEASPSARLPEAEAIAIVLDVLDGLEAIHGAGIVHRDLKPSNIFLVPEGGRERAKVLDFGIAKGASAPKLTRTGNAVGTPAYMAPEQLMGASGQIGPWTDLFQLGMIFFEMLTGVMAFPCEQMSDLILRCTRPPLALEPLGLNLDASAYDALFRRVLSVRREDRPPSAADFASSLRARSSRRPPPEWELLPAHSLAPTEPPPTVTDQAEVHESRVVAMAIRIPASRLARTEERRWVASLLPPGLRSFRAGSEIMLVVGDASDDTFESILAQISKRYGRVPSKRSTMPPGFRLSLGQLAGAGSLPEEVSALLASVI